MHLSDLLPVFCRIPAVPFLMGTPVADLSDLARAYGGTRESYREESPQFTVTLPAYAIAQTPVTNAVYAAYVAASDAAPPTFWRGAEPPQSLAQHPVVDITWHDAVACAAWLTAQAPTVNVQGNVQGTPDATPHRVTAPHLRLPTEAEWEHAARGTDGRTFPWGNTFDVAHANTREAAHNSTTAAGSFVTGASPYGLLDMAGNVWELTSTLDALYPYDARDGREDPHTDGRRIARGGCFANPHGYARCACRFRFAPTMRNPFLGFRLVCDLASPE